MIAIYRGTNSVGFIGSDGVLINDIEKWLNYFGKVISEGKPDSV